MTCTLAAADFLLTIEPKFCGADFPLSVDTSLRVHVESRGFCAEASMDVSWEDLRQFAAELSRLYRTLAGTAALEEPYSFHSGIRFTAERGGYILSQGRLTQPGQGIPEQELSFAGRFDQTYLKPFLFDLQKLFTAEEKGGCYEFM